MQRIIFETSPAFVFICLIVGIGYAFLLYQRKNPWGKSLTVLLFAFRAILAFGIALLLLGPIVKQIKNFIEKPVFAVVIDNSISMKEATDTLSLDRLHQNIREIESSLEDQGFEVAEFGIESEQTDEINYTVDHTDIHSALRQVVNQFEGRNIEGVLLVSDGIYNTGLSPLYASYNFPVNSLGVGDTLQRSDVSIKSLVYNKIAYEGNRFPLRADVLVRGYANQDITVKLLKAGKLVDQQTQNARASQFLTFDFQPTAEAQGIQRYDVQIDVKPGESNTVNNRSTAFVEVVKGKKKIVLIAAAPHPDIKALRAVVQKNPNYEFVLHIPGLEETEPQSLDPQNIDLVIFYQSPDLRAKTRELFRRLSTTRISMLVVMGQQTDLNGLMQVELPFRFDQPPRQYDEVTPVLNPAFSHFTSSSDANSVFSGFPPVSVHFGRIQTTSAATTLLFQKIGSLTTEKPLLIVEQQAERKVAVMLGEGLWRWRLHEYSRTENTLAFDEIFGKLIQYLSTATDKSKFRSYPVEQEFSTTESVVFESQVYNDIFEPVYGNPVEIEITNDKGQKKKFSYVINAGSSSYEIGGLDEGVYRYVSSTEISGRRETARGQFLVIQQQLELQNLTADFGMLRRLSANTDGKFYTAANLNQLSDDILKKQAQATIHSEETYDSMLNLKWVFFALLALASVEWFLRKFNGGY